MKLDFNETLERLAEDRRVSRHEVRADALRRKVWIAEWHLPGCISESFVICRTKREAIEAACSMAENEDGIPRGMKNSLSRYGRFDSQSGMFGTCINTIERRTLADFLE